MTVHLIFVEQASTCMHFTHLCGDTNILEFVRLVETIAFDCDIAIFVLLLPDKSIWIYWNVIWVRLLLYTAGSIRNIFAMHICVIKQNITSYTLQSLNNTYMSHTCTSNVYIHYTCRDHQNTSLPHIVPHLSTCTKMPQLLTNYYSLFRSNWRSMSFVSCSFFAPSSSQAG